MEIISIAQSMTFDIIKGEGATKLCQEIRILITGTPSFFVSYAYKVVDENTAWFLVEVSDEMKPYLADHFHLFVRSLYLRSLDRNLAKNPNFKCSFFFNNNDNQCLKVTYKFSKQALGNDELISKDTVILDEGFWKLFQLLKT